MTGEDNIWDACKANTKLTDIQGLLYRTVENQEQIATLKAVSSLEAQALLEDLLEESKPKLLAGTEKLPYLLATPFRYPPLRHGSRFGRTNEPGIFYGSLTFQALLSEDAYYRLLFRDQAELLKSRSGTKGQRTLISVQYKTPRGLKLHCPPFTKYKKELRQPADYRATQLLGSHMRANQIFGFEYQSARDTEAGINVGLFHPQAVLSKKPESQQNILHQTNIDGVSYRLIESAETFYFPKSQFLVAGKIPLPAG